jgi:hypothetical protein
MLTRKVQSGRPAKFHLFPQLPVELRVKIWHMAIESRIIRLTTAQVSNRHAWIAKASSPSNLLSVNQEARCEFLKRCILPFSTRVFTIGKTSVIHANDLHFNLDHDLIYVDLRYSNDFRATFQELFETIFKRSAISEFPLRKLAISGEDHPLSLIEPPRGTPPQTTIWEDPVLKQVQELVLVQDRNPPWHGFQSVMITDCPANSEWTREVEQKFAFLKSLRPAWNAPSVIRVASIITPYPIS